MSSSNCFFLTCTQISQEADKVVWYSHPLKNFPQFPVIHTVKRFGIVNKANKMFFWNSYFFNDPTDVGILISGSSAFSKSSLNIWNFSVHVLWKPGLESFEYYFASMWKPSILITWIITLPNSMKLWVMLCRATQGRQVMMESSDKTWSTGKGNGKLL